MIFDIPKITKVIELKEYAPEFEGASINVWVNPPLRLINEGRQLSQIDPLDTELMRERLARFNQVLAELWNWPVEDVKAMEDRTFETDPGLLTWLSQQTFTLIYEHRSQVKKNIAALR